MTELWWVALLGCIGVLLVLLLAVTVPIAHRRERAVLQIVQLLLFVIASTASVYVFGFAMGLFASIGFVIVVSYLAHTRVSLRLAAKIMKQWGVGFHAFVQKYGWLELFASKQSPGQRVVLSDREELLSVITASHFLSVQDQQMVQGALQASMITVRDVMMPLDESMMVSVHETVGPLLLDDMHRSGKTLFPVLDDDGKIVGCVNLDSLVDLKQHADVASHRMPVVHVSSSGLLVDVYEQMIREKAWLGVVRNDDERATIDLATIAAHLLGKPKL